MRSYIMKIFNIKIGIFLLTVLVGLNFFFQNCAPVRFTDTEAEAREREARRLALGADLEIVTVGLNPVPNLKLFFVVDNSGTMKQNNLNLAASFGSMFGLSADSLNKFESSTYLINTAQTVPSFLNEKTVIDNITNQQSSFSLSDSITESDFNTKVRTSEFNLGYLPGDNIGYQVSKSLSPLSYQFSPGMVLGTQNIAGKISFSDSIRKTASTDVGTIENQFKERLAILNAERIPQVLVKSEYQPENYQVVDKESGLCAVSRILKKPNKYINAGDLLSFIIVTDENDNDPAGTKCIESITQYDGSEDLVDGECKFKETQFSYQTKTNTKRADDCTIATNSKYKFKFTYNYITDVTYKIIKTAATYKAFYFNLKYDSLVNTYQYYNTDITYYIQNCYDVYSDEIKTGTKCTIDSVSKSDSKNGDFTDPAKCYDLAKSINSNAVNDVSYKPKCTGSYKSIATCSSSDVLCKITPTYKTITVSTPIIGENKASTCLAKAKTFSDYSKNEVCTDASKTVATCSTDESTNGCNLLTAAVYSTTSAKLASDQTADGCLSWAQKQTGNAVASTADISVCKKNITAAKADFNSTLNFSETKTLDGGLVLPTGSTASCGVLKALAYSKAPTAIQSLKNDDCVLTSLDDATSVTEALSVSTCNEQTTNKCKTSDSLRNCTLTKVDTYPATEIIGPSINDILVKEPLSCGSLCKDSKVGICGTSFPADQTIESFLKFKNGSNIICASATSTSEVGKEILNTKLMSEESVLCTPTVAKEPRFFFRTKGPYHLQSQVTEYVSGTKKDINNKDQVVPLVEFIKSKTQEMSSTNQILFSALVRKSGDPLGIGGSIGVDYEALIDQTHGQIDSVLSPDYSIALTELSKVIKNNLERSFILTKMRSDQIIMKVFLIKKDKKVESELAKTDWNQSGSTLKISDSLDFIDGDQFRVEYQNNISTKIRNK